MSPTRTTTDEPDRNPTTNLLVPGFVLASVPEGFLGEALFSRTFYAETLGSTSALGSRTNFARLLIQTERGFDLSADWHLLLRGEVGSMLVQDFSQLDRIYRFFAGGDRSVRGFAYQSLSPTELYDDNGVIRERTTGARHLITGSVELVRDFPLNLAGAAFMDAGNAFNKWGDGIEYSAGVGVRYRLPGLSIGLDIAKPLSTGGNYRLHLNITPDL